MTTDLAVRIWVGQLTHHGCATTPVGRLCDQPPLVKAAVQRACLAGYAAQISAERVAEARATLARIRSGRRDGGRS